MTEREQVVQFITGVVAQERAGRLISLSRIDGTVIGPHLIARPHALIDPVALAERRIAEQRARRAAAPAPEDNRAVGWRCQRCDLEFQHNQRCCPQCLYTVFSTVHADERPEWASEAARGGESS